MVWTTRQSALIVTMIKKNIYIYTCSMYIFESSTRWDSF